MIDAWGKIPEGILTGHVNSYGDFNECIDIKVSNLEYIEDALSGAREFDGQYCTAYILTYGILSELATTKTPKRNMYGLEHRFNAGSGNQTIQEALSLEEFLVRLGGFCISSIGVSDSKLSDNVLLFHTENDAW